MCAPWSVQVLQEAGVKIGLEVQICLVETPMRDNAEEARRLGEPSDLMQG